MKRVKSSEPVSTEWMRKLDLMPREDWESTNMHEGIEKYCPKLKKRITAKIYEEILNVLHAEDTCVKDTKVAHEDDRVEDTEDDRVEDTEDDRVEDTKNDRVEDTKNDC